MKTLLIALAAIFGTFMFLFIIGIAGKFLLWGGIIAGVLGLGRRDK